MSYNISDKHRNSSLREFVYILTYGRNKYKDITRNIEGIYKKKPYEICKLLTAVIDQDQTDRKRSYWSNDSRWDPLSVWHTIDSLMLDVDSVLFLQIQVHSHVC
jgi:hypothetical protein